MRIIPFLLTTLVIFALHAEDPLESISSDPGVTSLFIGTGELGKTLLQLSKDSPFRIGGIWTADGNILLTKRQNAKSITGNNLLIIGATFDTEKASCWKGGLFGINLLQYNGMNTNGNVGSAQGFDNLSFIPPFHRSELYQIWFRQSMLDHKLHIKIGKTDPSLDFNNIQRPFPTQNQSLKNPAITSLLYTPVFLNPANFGTMPAYYNSVYGLMLHFAPTTTCYFSGGIYDGSMAIGKQTGLLGPHFHKYYFGITEGGVAWHAGIQNKPGMIALGGWRQTGMLTIPQGIQQNGATGGYAFGSQRIWFRHPGKDDSGMSVFAQIGANNGKTLPIRRFIGAGCTAFGLTRKHDSFGTGIAWSKLNRNIYPRSSEWMWQTYYQALLIHTTFLEPVFTYIPSPGAGNSSSVSILTVQVISLF